jgi:bifunctional non-homologous end joining protein LigD
MLKKILASLPRASPQFIDPMQCKLVEHLPEGSEWLYEVKFDGYRALAIKNDKNADLISRNNKSLNRKYPELLSEIRDLRQKMIVLDGEVIATDENGRPSFQRLQNLPGLGRERHLLFYAFDILNYEGKELLSLDLQTRRGILAEVIKGTDGLIRLSHSLDTDAKDVIDRIQKFGLEGVVAKRKNSLYEPGERSGAWVKYKTENEQEFVVGGYRPSGVAGSFDLLLIGFHEKGKLMYSAKLKAGFTQHIKKQIYGRLKKLETKKCPFVNLPEGKGSRWGESLPKEEMEKCIWLKPGLIVRVQFVEWTSGGHLRHPKFVGIVKDKEARDVIREN